MKLGINWNLNAFLAGREFIFKNVTMLQ